MPLTLPAQYVEQGLWYGRSTASVCPIDRQQQRWPVCLLLNALRVGDRPIDLQLPAPRTSCRRAQLQRRSAANAGSVVLTAMERGWTQTATVTVQSVAIVHFGSQHDASRMYSHFGARRLGILWSWSNGKKTWFLHQLLFSLWLVHAHIVTELSRRQSSSTLWRLSIHPPLCLKPLETHPLRCWLVLLEVSPQPIPQVHPVFQKKYYSSLVSSVSHNAKRLWQTVNKLLHQRFSNWGPRTKGGPRRVPTGSARGFRKVVIVSTVFNNLRTICF